MDHPLALITMVTLPPPLQVRESRGSVNVSMSYTPDTKRLSVIILRAKDLNQGHYKETGEHTSDSYP